METEHTANTTLLPGTKKNKPVDIIRFIKRYTVFIIVMGNFLFTLMVPFVLLAIKPFYKVSAFIQIDPVIQTIIGKDQENSILQQYTDYSRTQAARLRNRETLKAAIERLTPEERDILFFPNASTDTAAILLDTRLYIKPISSTHLIELGLQGNNMLGLASIVNHIMTIYKEEADNTQKKQNDNRLAFLRSERDTLLSEIDNKINLLREVSRQTFTSEFSEAYNVFYKKVEQLQSANVRMALQLIDVESSYRQRIQEKKEIETLPMDSQVEEVVAGDWGLDSTQSWTYQQLQEMRTKLDGLSEGNSDRLYIEKRMEAMREYEKKMTDEVRKIAEQTVYGKRNYTLNLRMIEEQSRYDSLKSAGKKLSQSLAAAKQEAALNSERMITGEQLQAELTHMRGLLFKYESRINELVVQSNAPSRISIATPAYPPSSPAGNNAKKLFMVCIVLPYGMVFTFCFLLEYLDNRITSPQNITHALGSPSTWPISKVECKEESPFHELTLTDTESVSSKALRSLAIRIFKDHRANGSRIFLFSGVNEGNGTTDVLLNVAQLLGELLPRVLIIEGVSPKKTALKSRLNAPKDSPTIARATQLIESSINPEKWLAELDKIIFHDGLRGIHALFASQTMEVHDNPQTFEKILKTVNNAYDLIIVDSSPVMQNELTEYLSIFADVLVLVIQGNRTLYRELRRVAELFIRQEIPAIIPVLNWGGTGTLGMFERRFNHSFLEYVLKRIYHW
ncbi:GumC family protein [Desulfobacter vibrioformis]|uniref:GumC family protein n=1 Tax=Desulfobacter vibrioformis TaxID=34031 RepID=UPI0005579B77|nr:AAA family ATPase [Desulfobacter vibrioformis]